MSWTCLSLGTRLGLVTPLTRNKLLPSDLRNSVNQNTVKIVHGHNCKATKMMMYLHKFFCYHLLFNISNRSLNKSHHKLEPCSIFLILNMVLTLVVKLIKRLRAYLKIKKILVLSKVFFCPSINQIHPLLTKLMSILPNSIIWPYRSRSYKGQVQIQFWSLLLYYVKKKL